MDSGSYIVHLLMFLATVIMLIAFGSDVDKRFDTVEKKLDRIVVTQQATTTTQLKAGN